MFNKILCLNDTENKTKAITTLKKARINRSDATQNSTHAVRAFVVTDYHNISIDPKIYKVPQLVFSSRCMPLSCVMK